ncbi:AraC family transcriptional regulator [Chitinolyticbacter meiyuanensis]|uniref:AraC family transcriptional regulator n=1 Tax=Chitinolyticbacter meiyuanensis TaxID=682798 RepID=UPI0011E5C34E|nr:AraC family transcriptional regulator [Chitinolyticbacter meiyuanensis]
MNDALNRVLAGIEASLDADESAWPDLVALAHLAGCSPWHFHRQFAAAYGVAPGRYLQLLRLKRAAWRLAFRNDSVIRIALDCGYGSPEAFARAFRTACGQSPSAFRRRPDWPAWQQAFAATRAARSSSMQITPHADQVRIVDFPATPVAVLAYRGDPAGLADSIRAFIGWRRSVGLPPAKSATYNVLRSGPPGEVAPAEFAIDLCAVTAAPIAPNPAGVAAGLIPAGRCAVLRHVGSDDALEALARWLYLQWLPASGEALRDFPLFVERVRFFPDVPEREAVIDLFLPLA